MSVYERHILPHIINCACGSPQVLKLRSKVVPEAKGVVLEVGMGSAINLQFYDASSVDYIWGLEPSLGMREKAKKNVAASDLEVRWLDLPGENVPLDDDSVDTVLLTFTLCTIPDPLAALSEMRRVLKPNGTLLFCEHGWSPDTRVQKWQSSLNPVWSKIAGGCNVNREIDELIAQAGFSITSCQNQYIPATPKFLAYTYSGKAVLA